MAADPFDVSSQGTVTSVSGSAKRMGMHVGDHIISIGGQTVSSESKFYNMIRSHQPGDQMAVMIMPKDGTRPQMEMVPLSPLQTTALTAANILFEALIVLMSLFCVAVGVYVAAIRPYDVRALILLGLLLGVAGLVSVANASAFPPSLLEFVAIYRVLVPTTWPIWMFLFALYFPHSFRWDRHRPWIKYLLIVPLLVNAFLMTIDQAGRVLSFATVQPLDNFLNSKATGIVTLALSVIAISSFFALLGFKFGKSSKDSRRRLRILLAGAFVGLTPLFIFVLLQFALRDSIRSLPEWAVVVAVLLFCIFPLTLAYVIVVERAMDLKMVIRQGVRYGVATTGVRVAVFLVIGGAITAANLSVIGSKLPLPHQIAILVVTIVLVVALGRFASKQTLNWLDRKFFREAYKADQILEELSDSVRTIVDEAVLLETVTRTISQTLHVPNIAILLNGDGWYRPIHCHGIDLKSPVALAESGPTIEYVRSAKEPPTDLSRRPSQLGA